MRISYFIITVLYFSVSCKTVQENIITESSTDTIQFTYLYSEGLKYLMLGNENTAKDIFKKCLKVNKQSSATAYQLSDIFLKEDKLDSAKFYSDFCLKIVPENEWFLLQNATIAQKMGDVQKYSSIYKKLVDLFPENLNYNYELAVILFNEKKYDESLKILNNIEETTGVDEDISYLKNNIFYSENRFDALQAELLKLKVFYPDSVKYMDLLAEFYLNTNQSDKAFGIYRNILEIDKTNINAYYGYALLYAKSQNYSKGYEYLKYVLENTDFDKSKKESLANLYLESSKSGLTQAQITFIYQNLLNDTSFKIDLLNDYLAFLFKLRELTETEKVAKFSIKNRPDNYWGWDYLFQIFIAQSRNEELYNYTLKALEYFPNHSQIYFYAGYSSFVLRKYNEAINYLETGLSYLGDNKNLELQFYLYLAESYHSVSKHKKSDEYFELYLKQDSSNSYLMNNYAFYLVSRSLELDKAAGLSMKSIEIEPFNSTFLDTYSWILFNKQKYDDALNYIERSYRYGGNKNSIIVEHYGDILQKLGRENDALNKWEEAYSLNRNNENLLLKINKYKIEKKP